MGQAVVSTAVENPKCRFPPILSNTDKTAMATMDDDQSSKLVAFDGIVKEKKPHWLLGTALGFNC